MAACLRSGSASKYIYNRVAGHAYHASTSEKKPNVWTLKSPIRIINCTKSKLIFETFCSELTLDKEQTYFF